jgi:hypothetical protein
MTYLEKTWGLKVKSMKYSEPTHDSVKITVEFTKDLDELKGLAQEFGGGNSTLWFYSFDEEMVVLNKVKVGGLEGELTGKKGDAFRFVITLDPKKTRTVEARSTQMDKAK